MGKELLDLDALVPDRPTVRIRTENDRDGKLWELRVRAELSIAEIQNIMRLAERVDALGSDMTLETMTTVQESTDKLLKIAFAGPYDEELRDVLTLEHKVAIVEAFSTACLTQTPVKQAKAKRSTGARS